MFSQGNVPSIDPCAVQPFNVIEEFAALSSKRKSALCDSLFANNQASFENATRMLWPHASTMDIKKLEKFLMIIKQSSN